MTRETVSGRLSRVEGFLLVCTLSFRWPPVTFTFGHYDCFSFYDTQSKRSLSRRMWWVQMAIKKIEQKKRKNYTQLIECNFFKSAINPWAPKGD